MGAHSNYITVDGDFATALWLFALIITIVTLVMIVKAVKTIIEIVKSAKTEEREVVITSDSSKDNFFYNRIEEDIANSDIQLSDEAKNLLSTYRD